MNTYYPGKPVNIHIQYFKIIFRITIGSLTPKKGRGKLPLLYGNE